MSITLSTKKNKALEKKNQATESKYHLNEISDFGISLNREKDWANIITIHKNSEKPCVWSGENHSIIKMKLEAYETEEQKLKMDAKNNFPSSCFVTRCGNFGVLGFKNGLISKVNMQSGLFQRNFFKQASAHKSLITALLVDPYNKYLVSGDKDGLLAFWDFYSGILLDTKTFGGDNLRMKPIFLRQAHYSHLLLIGKKLIFFDIFQ